jgi:hypothetical protein
MRPVLVLLLICALNATAAPLPFPRKKDQGKSDPPDLKAIQGDWVVTRFTYGNVVIRMEDTPCLTASVKGNHVTFRRSEGAVPEWSVSLLPGESGRGSPGVYRLERGQLVITLVPPGTSRPVNVEVPGRDSPVWVLRRKQ